MEISLPCIGCVIAKTIRQLKDYPPEPARRCLSEVLEMLAHLEPGTCVPLADYRKEAIVQRYFPVNTDMTPIKRRYNEKMMVILPRLQARVDESEDSLASAIAFAAAGNYIDFGTMDTVEDDRLDSLIAAADTAMPPREELDALRQALAAAKSVVYLHDNCGEIVLDKLLLREISRFDVQVTSIVRGAPVINDATVEDAAFCGIEAIGNGSAVAGTDLSLISEEALSILRSADVIISKGQANFETLYGNNLPAYYIFLCKCDYFSSRFGLEKFKPVFARESSIGRMLHR